MFIPVGAYSFMIWHDEEQWACTHLGEALPPGLPCGTASGALSRENAHPEFGIIQAGSTDGDGDLENHTENT
ncbi:hypothetical protein MJO28_017426 [Puccinia striiformis f. sp. tritici]|nr:hypothetical protein MJO28_017426 [Puccinia striiformis f. sp. tritici]